MNTWEAEELGLKLATSFPRSSISAGAWATELADCHHNVANEAIRRIIRTSEHAPTIAHYWATYRSLLGTAHDDTPCERCGGDTWITDTNHPHHWPGKPGTIPIFLGPDGQPQPDECICNVVRPCPACNTGHKGRRAA